jgi:photosystem II stability/assembly factor-like uncharacterized protein
VDVQTIWQCGANGVSLSTDGGKTWEATAEKAGGMSCILAFADTETGWAGSGAEFQMTTDGGATWEELVLPEDVSRVAAVSLRTPTDGYLVDMDGVLHITQDGGKTWSSKSLGLDDPSVMDLETPLAAVRFFDAENGLVVLGLFGESSMIALRTADGAETWQEESLPVGLGTPYLSRDGKFLAVHQFSKGLTLFKYE